MSPLYQKPVEVLGKSVLALLLGLVFLGSIPGTAKAADGHGASVQPAEASELPRDIGRKAHVHLRLFSLAKPFTSAQPRAAGLPPYPGYFFETPASLACIYRIAPLIVAGCNPNTVTSVPNGGSKAIAIVDAYDNPTAAADLQVFSNQFGLPAANFSTVYAAGTRPAFNANWAIEEALDVEWAHAMAPYAKIYLVEAGNSTLSSLISAVQAAANLVAGNGGGEVSMSWGSSEFSGETAYDSAFVRTGVVFVASAGDSAGVSYPSASVNVVSAGGASINRSPADGAFLAQGVWQLAGGGPSAYEPRPAYQNGRAPIVGASRATPDFVFDADPATGVWVYNSSASGPNWYILGGTSVAAPALSGILNASGTFARSTAAELSLVYANSAQGNGFAPVTLGDCGPYNGYIPSLGSPFCAGAGAPITLVGK